MYNWKNGRVKRKKKKTRQMKRLSDICFGQQPAPWFIDSAHTANYFNHILVFSIHLFCVHCVNYDLP